MARPIYQVDAFADGPFAGNPAAVCLLDDPADERWMQQVAAEMNLSETAYVRPIDGGAFELRWFTPAAEVELCGHATLASAHLLWEIGEVDAGQAIAFHTRYRGMLRCTRVADEAGLIAMDFPADRPEPADTPAGLVEALRIAPSQVRAVSRGAFDWLVELPDESAVRELSPDFGALVHVGGRGLAVTAKADAGRAYDLVSRFFAPSHRIDEDPVTGSLHCLLGPYWQARLGKATLEAYQASARGGRLRVTVRGDRVELAGRAVTVLRGELLA